MELNREINERSHPAARISSDSQSGVLLGEIASSAPRRAFLAQPQFFTMPVNSRSVSELKLACLKESGPPAAQVT